VTCATRHLFDLSLGPIDFEGTAPQMPGVSFKAALTPAHAWLRLLALLWQILAIDRRYWIPESGFQ